MADVGAMLAVEAVPEELEIRVRAGQAWVDGHFYRLTEQDTWEVDTADLTNPRVDRVMLEYADTRPGEDPAGAQIVVLTGTPASSPEPPALTQEDGHYQLPLARFTVPAAAPEIDPEDIVDERVFSEPLSVRFVDDAAERDAIPEDSRTVVWRRDVERFEAWDRQEEVWVPGPPEHQHNLADNADVSAPDPDDGDALVFNAGEARWESRKPQPVVGILYRSTTQSLASGSAPITPIQWDDVELDAVGGWDSGTPERFQPDVAGWYEFTGGISFSSNNTGGRRGGSWFLNGVEVPGARVSQEPASQGWALPTMKTVVVQLDGVGDYVELRAMQDTGSGLNTVSVEDAAWPLMIVKRLGPAD